jgi:plastocyanin
MMIDIKYMPMELRIAKGTTVAWTNDDQVAHSITKRKGPGPMFDSGLKAPGTVYTQRFDTKGTIDYYCTIHPNQLGKLIVT